MEGFSDFIQCMREQRHDFMNNFQVIYGYLQIGKIEEAEQYIEKISKRNQIISEVHKIGAPYFAFSMEKFFTQLWNKEIEIEMDIEIENFYYDIFEKEYNKKWDLVNTIFIELENTKLQFVYIYVFEDELGQSILLTNDESMCDELNWMEEWEKEEIVIEDMEVHQCRYEEYIAYRITFNKKI